MYEYVKNHALLNVWCNPEQDNQIILKAAKVSRPTGEFIATMHMERRLVMPTNDRRYHLFQIGDIGPKAMGLLPDDHSYNWVNYTEAVNKLDLVVNLYNQKGLNIPLYRSYYIYTKERALIFAIDISSLQGTDLDDDNIYLRLYTNAWYSSEEGKSLVIRTKTDGRVIFNSSDVVYLRNRVSEYNSLAGTTFSYVEGILRETINMTTAQEGDSCEVVYDASVKRIVDWKVEDLHTFTSELDSNYKYLLHYPGEGEDIIDYVDDIDVYVLYKEGNSVHGLYVPRNLASTLRMVTHRDYAISVDAVFDIGNRLIDMLGLSVTVQDLYVRLYIRNSGMIRPLIKEANRVFELYKLDEDRIMRALTGVDSLVEFWSAPKLENSGYTELMRTPVKSFDIDLVERAYGYNGLGLIIANTPTKIPAGSGAKYITLDVALRTLCTVYEYDENGYLLEWYIHENATQCLIRHDETRLVEAIVGQGTRNTDIRYGTDLMALPRNHGYRVYMAYQNNGERISDWQDITDSEHYRVEHGILIWNNLESDQLLMVRSDKTFLAYDLPMHSVGGAYYFDLVESKPGTEDFQVLEVPLGDLDIWVNGRSLVPGIGFRYEHPRVVILDKEALKQPAGSTQQLVTIRFSRLAYPSGITKPVEDSGFVVHGMLSDNAIFNIRDDKVLRISVGGSVRHRDDVLFSEEHSGVSVVNAINGMPYQIKEIVVPMEGWSHSKTYEFRQQAVERDEIVSNYMTAKLPEFERDAVSSMVQRYRVYSPFMSRIINDIANENFDMTLFEREVTDNEILAVCEPYEEYLAFDPINEALGFNRNFVLIEPHHLGNKIGVSYQAYSFIQRVANLYAPKLINLSEYLVVLQN